MVSDTTLNNIPNISQLWDKSYIAINEVVGQEKIFFHSTGEKVGDLIVLCGIIAFFLVAYRRIFDGLYFVFSSFYNTKKLLDIDLQNNTQICRDTLFYFLTLCVAFMIGNITQTWSIKGSSYTTFVIFSICCAAIFGYFLIKKVLCNILDWVNKSNTFSTVFKISISFAIINYTALICGFIVYRAIESISPATLITYSFVSTFISLFAFYVNGYKIFLSNGFSHFFYILYLCTLEILPLVVIWDIIYA